MSEKHLSSQSDTDLTTTSTKVLQMGGLVEAQIVRAVHALVNFDTTVCDQVLAVGQGIDALEIEIDGDCSSIITRCWPTARDLRLVMAISKTITNLERAGDEAVEVAERTKRLMQDPFVHALNYADVDRSGETTVAALCHTLDIFIRLDTTAAVSTLQEDKAIDEEFRGFMHELITCMMRNLRMVSVVPDLLFIARTTERIGDHAGDIAEFITHIVKETDVRYTGCETLEREILGGGEQEDRTRDVSMPSSILVVEDEPTIAKLIAVNLQHVRYYLTRTYNTEQASSLMSDVLLDPILLDWMLPGKSEAMFAKELRVSERTCRILIIMLTAHSEEQGKIVGLDNGAGDYAIKPFSPKKLLARIKAVLYRRVPQLTDDMMAINDLKLGPATYCVMVTDVEAGSPIKLDLGPMEPHLLHFLMTHPKRIRSRSQLLDRVWGDHVFIEECTMDVHIRRLRAALAPGGYSNMIETVHGSDYHLTCSPGQ